MPKVPKIIGLQHFSIIVKENVKDEVGFLPADEHQRFLQIDTIILGVCVWPVMPKLSKITSLLFLFNIFGKKLVNEVDFLHADKHENFLQIDTMVFDADC